MRTLRKACAHDEAKTSKSLSVGVHTLTGIIYCIIIYMGAS
jgi:hypothetical protein